MSVCLSCGSRAACCCGASFALPAFCGTGFRRMLIKVKTGGALRSCLRYDRTFHCKSAKPFPFTALERDLLLPASVLLLCRSTALISLKPSTHSPIPESCALTVFTNQGKSNVKVVPRRALETGTGTGIELHCIRCRSVVSSMLRPMYPRGKGCRCPLSRGATEFWRRSESFIEKVSAFCRHRNGLLGHSVCSVVPALSGCRNCTT